MLERIDKFRTKRSYTSGGLSRSSYPLQDREGSVTQQNRVRDYVIFAILPRLHWDYTRFAQGLHIFVIQELA